jgi:hypothetical protein
MIAQADLDRILHNAVYGNRAAGAPAVPQPQSRDAVFQAEYAQSAAHYRELGLSEEEFVRMRRVDEGLEELWPHAARAQQTQSQEPAADLADPDNQRFRQEYAADAEAYREVGLTEADFVATRRVDEGLDTLQPDALRRRR